jgi:hypothetical protein
MSLPSPATTDETAGRVVPDFRADEAARAQYAQSLERRIKAYFSEQDDAIRRTFAAKRESLAGEILISEALIADRNEAAQKASAAYRIRYPHRFPKSRPVRPAFFEVVLSFGAASRLFGAIAAANSALIEAQTSHRRFTHKDEELDSDLNRALAHAVDTSKATTASPEWLAALHRDPALGAMKARVDAIEREREDYGQRLKAGRVPDDELRDRAFAELEVRPLEIPLSGMMFYRVDRYGALTYCIVRDLEKRFYALPYDPRLEAIIDGVFDVFRVADRFEVRGRIHAESKLPFTILDHFIACNDRQELIARGAYRDQRVWMKKPRSYAATPPTTDAERELVTLLVDYSETIPSPRAPIVN